MAVPTNVLHWVGLDRSLIALRVARLVAIEERVIILISLNALSEATYLDKLVFRIIPWQLVP